MTKKPVSKDPEAHKEAAKALDGFLKNMNKILPGSVFLGDDANNPITNVEVIPTGALSLDMALGCGGLPKGRWSCIYGPESSGKTSCALAIAANAQKEGGLVGFIDAEYTFNKTNAEAMGVDLSRLVLAQPDSGTDAFKQLWAMCDSKLFDLVILDSLAALIPDTDVVDDASQVGNNKQIGAHAAMVSKGMRSVTKKLAESKTAVLIISQIRMKPGAYGNPEDYGPQALKFYSSIVIDIRSSNGDKIKKRINGKEVPIGQTIRATIRKNKLAPPHRTAQFDLFFDSGISGEGSLIDAAVELGIIIKSGASFTDSESGERIAYGKDNFKETLAEDPELTEKLMDKVYKALKSNTSSLGEDDSEVDEELVSGLGALDIQLGSVTSLPQDSLDEVE